MFYLTVELSLLFDSQRILWLKICSYCWDVVLQPKLNRLTGLISTSPGGPVLVPEAFHDTVDFCVYEFKN